MSNPFCRSMSTVSCTECIVNEKISKSCKFFC